MNAVVLMAVGRKYLRDLGAVKASFERYAERCNATLVICETPPDPTFKRNLLCQKLLLPSLYKKYEWIAFCDTDILISREAPSLFDQIDDSKAFSAVVDQRGSTKYVNVVNHLWKQPAILDETHSSYFSSRGFPDHPFPQKSINGGVWLCKPEALAEEFRSAYFSGMAPTSVHEEPLMAYVSQKHDLFFELDPRFNIQFLYELFTPPDSPITRGIGGLYFRCLKRFHKTRHPWSLLYPKAYTQLVDQILARCYFLHFCGGFPFIQIPSKLALRAGTE